jgi:hypothetical protein
MIEYLDKSIIVFNEFLSKEKCLPYIEKFKKEQPHPEKPQNWVLIHDDPIVNEVKTFLESVLNINIKSAKAGIGVWLNGKGGADIHVHSPESRPDNDFTSCLYLNDDFLKGEFYTHNLIYKPKTGSLTFFNGMKTYHGCNNPIGNDRYYLIFWWEGTTYNDCNNTST